MIKPLINKNWGQNEYKKSNDLDDLVYDKIGDHNLLYFNLAKLMLYSNDLHWSEYFSSLGSQYDGILFFKEIGGISTSAGAGN